MERRHAYAVQHPKLFSESWRNRSWYLSGVSLSGAPHLAFTSRSHVPVGLYLNCDFTSGIFPRDKGPISTSLSCHDRGSPGRDKRKGRNVQCSFGGVSQRSKTNHLFPSQLFRGLVLQETCMQLAAGVSMPSAKGRVVQAPRKWCRGSEYRNRTGHKKPDSKMGERLTK